jgi:hypothetical protein
VRLKSEGIPEAKDGATPGPNDPRRLAVRAGSFVTPEIVSMFSDVSGAKPYAAESAVARRAWGLLNEWNGPGLLQDLAALASHSREAEAARDGGECSERRYWEFLLTHYHEVRVSRPCSHTVVAALAGFVGGGGGCMSGARFRRAGRSFWEMRQKSARRTCWVLSCCTSGLWTL